MSTPPEDIDALFDAPAPPAPAAAPPAGPVPAYTENRREPRARVNWPARVQLPNGKVLELRVRDVSDSGVGFFTSHHIPPATVLNFAMGVPDLDEPGRLQPVLGTIRTTYVILNRHDLLCGGSWVELPEAQREFLGEWLRRLRK